MAEAFLKTTGGDPKALLLLMNSFPSVPRTALAAFTLPVLVLTGAQDNDNGSALALAEALPDAVYVEVPGNHMSAVTLPDLGDAIARWF
jgi:pimeloyl-ACP methyl ester carboxylesterase